MKKVKFEEKYIVLQQTTSTNNYAIAMLAEKKPAEGTVIQALEQTQGKGCGTNAWHSEAGKNLTFSIILYPRFLNPENEFLIAKTISLALTDFLVNFINPVTIKWPNDIYVQDSKIGGILIENLISNGVFSASIVGIGLNINQELFPAELPNPVSVIHFTKTSYDLKMMIKQLYFCIVDRYEQLKRYEYNEITRDYLSKIYRYNQDCIFVTNGKEFTGRIVHIEPDGKVVIADETGHSRKYYHKEVTYKL